VRSADQSHRRQGTIYIQNVKPASAAPTLAKPAARKSSRKTPM